jgi:hypothetical protein
MTKLNNEELTVDDLDLVTGGDNLQYLQLQNSMQNDNRQFQMVSNILNADRSTAKNMISNIR